jgi:hypothetical protein
MHELQNHRHSLDGGVVRVGMKRFLIFPALGTPLAVLVGLCLTDNVRGISLWSVGQAIGALYVIGLIPSAVVGVFDAMLAAKHIPYRMAGTAVVGGVISFALLRLGFEFQPLAILVGAIPAAVCSWLSGRTA